jgi:hypothetical protein
MKTLTAFAAILFFSGCAAQIDTAREDGFLTDNIPDTKKDFLKYKRKCLRIKKGFGGLGGYPIDNKILLNTSFSGEVDEKYEYTYLIWIYTGFYDAEQMCFPWYIYPQTPKGEVMSKGCLRGINLKPK